MYHLENESKSKTLFCFRHRNIRLQENLTINIIGLSHVWHNSTYDRFQNFTKYKLVVSTGHNSITWQLTLDSTFWYLWYIRDHVSLVVYQYIERHFSKPKAKAYQLSTCLSWMSRNRKCPKPQSEILNQCPDQLNYLSCSQA